MVETLGALAVWRAELDETRKRPTLRDRLPNQLNDYSPLLRQKRRRHQDMETRPDPTRVGSAIAAGPLVARECRLTRGDRATDRSSQ
jgi:hypothetical protein